ncbi:MAG: alpha/beta fold hydrolase [Alphaproteobacteria bacterium]
MASAPGREIAIAAACDTLFAQAWNEAGAAPDPVVVFLHEALGCAGGWHGLPTALCARAGLRGLAYDRLGHGRSPARHGPQRPGYLRHEAETVLPAVLAAAGIARPVLYGHSDGATIALMFAAAFPDRVAAVVAEAPHVFVEDETRAGIRAAMAAFAAPRLRARLARHHGDKTDALLAGWSGTWLSREFADWSIVDAMARIGAPVLLVQGADDQYGTRRQLEAIARRVRGPVVTALLSGVGHAPHRETQALVVDLAAGFLAREAPAAAIRPPAAPSSAPGSIPSAP